MKNKKTLRHPIVSGMFYPDQKDELESIIDGYLEKVNREELIQSIRSQTGFDNPPAVEPLIIISPHAGFIFSGAVQACSYFLFQQFDFNTVVIIGPAHQSRFKGISVNLDSAYNTPLGDIEVDLEFANRLIEINRIFQVHEDVHLSEHAVEVQLPFIQKVSPGAQILPILFGEQNWDNALILKDALISIMKERLKDYIIIASSDLSHYHSHVDAASLDRVLIDELGKMDPKTFYSSIQEGRSEACGWGGILTGILIADEVGKKKSAVLKYMDSGEVSGDRRRVVGYLSAVLY